MSSASADRTPVLAWTDVARASILLAIAGASTVLGSQLARLPGLRRFVEENVASPTDRRALVGSVVAGAIVPLLVAAALLWRKGGGAVPWLTRAADLASPLVVAAFVPPLLADGLWQNRPLGFLLLLVLTGIVLEQALRRFLGALPNPKISVRTLQALPLAIVVACAVAYTVYTSSITIDRLRSFKSGSFDMGIYDNLMASALEGRFFRAPILFGPDGGNYLAGHAEFAMILFLPLYALHPGAETLLVLQAFMVGFAAVPLFLFASTQISRPAAAIVSLGYLLYAPLHGAQWYDFHWLTISVFFLFWLFFAIATRRNWLVALTVPILFALREDIAVGIAILGVFLVVTGERPKLGALLAIVSVLWFGLDKFVIMPAAGTWWFENIYKDLIAPGEKGYGSIVKTIIVNPVYFFSTLQTEAKLVFALHIFAPLAFIPLRRPHLALLALPGFFFTLMTTGYVATLSLGFQYAVHFVPYVFAASVIFLRQQGESGNTVRARAALGALCLCLLVHSYAFGAVLKRSTFGGGLSPMTSAQVERYEQLGRLAAMIPKKASVAATDPETPLLSARATIYSLFWHRPAADYLLIEREYAKQPRVHDNIADVIGREPYGLFAHEGSRYYLFRRGLTSQDTRAAALELGIDRIAE
jgi:uncharacterized membrane protein